MSRRAGRVFLTGATGFIGSHVLRSLLEAEYDVRALVREQRPGVAERPAPVGLEGYEKVFGDLTRPGELAQALRECRYLVHVAGLYSFAPGDRRQLWLTNVAGCAGILEAARIAGVERAVVTSSSATVRPAPGDRPATEADRVSTHDRLSGYHASKVAEEMAATAAQLPVVVLLPTAPIGPGDWKPTPTGKLVVDFMRGRIRGSVPGGMNVVAVEDVGSAHVLALERGKPGECYLIGGENLSFDEIWRLIGGITGRPAPTLRVPHALALTLGWADELRCRLRKGAQPLVPLEGVRMSRHRMYVTADKAAADLGYRPSSVAEAVKRSVSWYQAYGYA